MILFGVSNMLSDIYDCANALGKKISMIIINTQELRRARTKGFETRLQELNEKPRIISLSEFTPQEGEEYFVVPTTPEKSPLIDCLKNTYQLEFARLIHPTAYVSPYAKIGEDVYIGAKSVIGAGTVIKDHVFINRGVTVGHDNIIHEYVRLQPGCNVGGHVEILYGAMIGLGANVIEEIVIGRGAVVAAGAVVIQDVKDKTMVCGVPAVIKKTYED